MLITFTSKVIVDAPLRGLVQQLDFASLELGGGYEALVHHALEVDERLAQRGVHRARARVRLCDRPAISGNDFTAATRLPGVNGFATRPSQCQSVLPRSNSYYTN